MYNRSVRRSDDADMREKFLASGGASGNDKIDTFELRFERQHSKYLWFAFSGYHSDYEVVSFSGGTQDIQPIGNLEFYGLEIEGTYRTDKTRVTFSHNYTQLINFELEDKSTSRQNISAEPYGFGDDLANWSDHTTKLTAEYDFDPKWTASSTLRCLWGYPGAEDGAEYNKEVLGDNPALPISDGSGKAFDVRAYLNLGLEFRQTKSTTWRLDAFNVLGWIDKDVNKRNVFWRSGQYRDEAAALALTYRHKF
jgi:iron complex outermembrane receptor protein